MSVTEIVSKRCSTCRETKPTKDFSKNCRQLDSYQNACKVCIRFYWNRWHQENYTNPEYRNRLNGNQIRVALKRSLKRYGITVEQYEVLVSKGCAICAGPSSGRGRYHFAENKFTGAFGGLLCNHCNTALGLLKYDVERLKKMIDYLIKNSQSA